MARFIIFIQLLFVSIIVNAQPICKVRIFGTENGLPASIVSGMTQSTDNLVWLTSWNGLSCFDGYRFTTFRNIPGHDSQLTTNHLISAMPAKDGNLWVTTYAEDFYLFDSHKCQYVNVSAIISKKFHNKFSLRKIYPLPNGATWFVGKYNDHYRMASGDVEKSDNLAQMNLPGTLNKVVLDPDNGEWLLCDQGAFLYQTDGKVWKVTSQWVDFVEKLNGMLWLVTMDGKIMRMANHSKPQIVYTATDVDKVNDVKVIDDYLALATDQGLLMYDTKKYAGRMISMSSPSNPVKKVSTMFCDSQKRLWCFNDGLGFMMVEKNLQPAYLLAKGEGSMLTVADKPIFHEDSHHTVWIAPKNGCFSYYDEKAGTLIPQQLSQVWNGGLMFPKIRKGYSDNQGNLWLIYPHNISLVSFAYSKIQTIDLGLKRDTRSVMQDHEGNILLGTVDGDIVKCSPDGKVIGYLAPDGHWQTSKTTFSYHIYSLYEDKRNRLWVGTKGNGLYCVSSGKVVRYTHDDTNAYTLNSDEVYDIKEDTRGRLLLATFEGGLNISEDNIYKTADAPASLKFLHCNNMLKGYVGDVFNKVRRIEVLPNGVVVLSTTQGLLTYSDRYTYPDRIRFYVSRRTHNEESLYSSEVMQTMVAPDGFMYVVTLGGGLQRTDAKNLLRDDLLFSPVGDDNSHSMQFGAFGTMQGMVRDNQGDLWIVGESRIACIGKSGLSEFAADEIGGVNISEALPSHSSKTDRIVIGTEGGAITFLPKQMDRSSYAPNIVFTSLRFMDRDDEQPILNMPELSVDVNHRSFSVFFSALDYSSHSSVSTLGENCGIRYAYRVDDGEWIYLHRGSNCASFNHFPAGTHTISVRSTNGDGVWIDNERQLVVYAEPTFVESWWGRTIIFLILLTVSFFAFKTYMKKRAAEIKDEAEEKADAVKVSFMLRKPEIIDEDKAFIDRLLAYIEDNIGNPELKVDDMASAVGMGRSTFYSRLKQIAEMSPNDFLRHIRMRRAEELVRDSKLTFSQIAYSVGFSDPKYFGKCFKKHTGKSPSEYRIDSNSTAKENGKE